MTCVETVRSTGAVEKLDRVETLLPRTLASLTEAGFPAPRLFVDGAKEGGDLARFGLEMTCRYPAIRTHGNWILALYELYIRNPNAERYAIFQDDFVTYRNLKVYLEHCRYPAKGYWNLYTFPANQARLPKDQVEPCWFLSDQLGKGAVALVFDLETVLTLLASRHMVDRPRDPHRGWRAIDGGVVTSLSSQGWKEYCHSPSLVQHTGAKSTMENRNHPLASSFRGEDYDATAMINRSTIVPDRSTVEAWQIEYNALTEAIAGDEERLRKARNPAEVGRYERLLFNYRVNLKKHMTIKPEEVLCP